MVGFTFPFLKMLAMTKASLGKVYRGLNIEVPEAIYL